MESLCEENVRYALRFGFTRGVYAGFQQCFVADTTKQPFEELAANQILKEPGMRKYIEYYQRRRQFNGINEALDGQLDETGKEHLVSVYSMWENRIYGVLRHSFYLGYRYALSMMEDVEAIGTSTRYIEKILLTEHELGFTPTVAERERQSVG